MRIEANENLICCEWLQLLPPTVWAPQKQPTCRQLHLFVSINKQLQSAELCRARLSKQSNKSTGRRSHIAGARQWAASCWGVAHNQQMTNQFVGWLELCVSSRYLHNSASSALDRATGSCESAVVGPPSRTESTNGDELTVLTADKPVQGNAQLEPVNLVITS